MTVLVTGGAGYIGSHMVLELIDAGDNPVVLDNLSTGFRRAVPGQVPIAIGDIADSDLVVDLISRFEVESIIHFAGSIVVPESISNPLGYYLNNTVGTHNLIEVAVRTNVKNFIFSSTAAVYGIPEKNPVFEGARLAPISPYGSSKMMTETMLSDTAKAHGLNYMALRYFNVAGADPKGRAGQSSPVATHLIKVASQAALGQRPYLDIFGTDYATKDGTCVRDYIHVTDLVRAHLKALIRLRDGGESRVLNCGYGRGHSVREVVEAVRRNSGRDFEVRESGRRSGDPAELVAGAQEIRTVLNWVPIYDNLDTIVGQALEWEERLQKDPLADCAGN